MEQQCPGRVAHIIIDSYGEKKQKVICHMNKTKTNISWKQLKLVLQMFQKGYLFKGNHRPTSGEFERSGGEFH